MAGLRDPAAVNAMNNNPEVEVTRTSFTWTPQQAFQSNCLMYYTPQAPEKRISSTRRKRSRPTEPKDLSPRKRGRPSEARKEKEAQHKITPKHDREDLEEYEAAMEDITDPNLPYNPDLIFTHGRGSTVENPAVVEFCKGFGRTKTVCVFTDIEDITHRVETFRAHILKYPSASALGGRSMGARASARAQIYSRIKLLIFFTYPLVRGLDERYEEVLSLTADTDVLFILGDSDPLCHEMHLSAIRSRMKARTWWIRMIRGDHALWYEDTQRDRMCNVAGQLAAWWCDDGNRDAGLTELTLDWDDEARVATWTNWTAPSPKPEAPQTRFNVSVVGSHLPGGGGNFSLNL